MPMIPRFTGDSHWEEFSEIFSERVGDYLTLLEIVKDRLLGNVKWCDLDAKMIEVLGDIARTQLYDTEWEFKQKHPEYESQDDEIFIPRKSFQEKVTEALKEALKAEEESKD